MLGKRDYTISDKCRRPSKASASPDAIRERNRTQKRIYVNLGNIAELFSDNDSLPLNYGSIRSHIFSKMFKFLPTASLSRKNEATDDCMTILYSTLYRKLRGMKGNVTLFHTPEEPELFFYHSQFIRYIELLVYSYCFYNTRDVGMFADLPEDYDLFEITDSHDDGAERTERKVSRSNIRRAIRESPLSDSDKEALLSILSGKNNVSDIDGLKGRLDECPDFRDRLYEMLGGISEGKPSPKDS